MSIFGSIMSKVFGHTDTAATASVGGAPSTSTPGAAGTMPQTGKMSSGSATASTSTGKGDVTGSIGAAPSGGPVDVEALMSDLARKSGRPSNWRVSIVDLMSLLGLESSLATRKDLAKELGYTGDMNDSASMNIWLHKQVMTKLAENGGKVPDDLKHHA